MYLIVVMLMFVFIMVMVLMLINYLISKKMIEDREKKSSYECGFDSFNSSRLPYSIHFFLISLVFLVFDFELMILLPMILIYEHLSWINYLTYMYMLMIFFLGLWIEWIEGSMDWNI